MVRNATIYLMGICVTDYYVNIYECFGMLSIREKNRE